jgi:NhaP-type Na+/H+ or K+/H+ antiporter
MYLQENGYGVDKEIPTILIAAASFDDIIAILLFGMFSDMEFSNVGETHHEPYETAYIHAYQIATGIVVGLSLGLILGLSLRNKPNTRPYKFLKLILVLITLIVIIAAVELSGFVESRYI